MSADPADLANLHDIVVPPPVPWLPPAPGWLWLAGFAGLVLLALLLRGFARWQQNRYRREALAELDRLETAAGDTNGRGEALAGLSVLLKRTALTAYGRQSSAPLTGPDWFAFLDANGGTHFADGTGAALEDAVYRRGSVDDNTLAGIVAGIRAWIRGHRPLQVSAADGAVVAGTGPTTAAAARRAA